MNIAIGCDHGGFPLKLAIIGDVETLGHTVKDCGARALVPDDDFPEYARAVGEALQRGEAERGVLICGSGVGASIAASKMSDIRAALCHDTYSAHQGVEHDDMNVLCLGARVVGDELAKELVRAFLGARFIGEGKYLRRVNEIMTIEREQEDGEERIASMPAVNLISREELKVKLDHGDNFKLVMSLPDWAYRAKHIPGSVVASTQAELLTKVKPNDEIVVYCSTKDCIASAVAYQILMEHGYKNVRHFRGGLLEWEDAGYPLEGKMVAKVEKGSRNGDRQ